MTDLSKRSLMKLAALTAVASAALIGCGKKEEAAPAPAPAPAVVEAPKAEPLKIAFAYVGPVGDGGWTFAHDNARLALEKEFGDKIVTTAVEKVPESADAERVFRDFAGHEPKIEPLPPGQSGVLADGARVPFDAVQDVASLREDLGARAMAGFGGVAEYGITVRWDKNYLKMVRLLLERRGQFSMFGGVRFGVFNHLADVIF